MVCQGKGDSDRNELTFTDMLREHFLISTSSIDSQFPFIRFCNGWILLNRAITFSSWLVKYLSSRAVRTVPSRHSDTILHNCKLFASVMDGFWCTSAFVYPLPSELWDADDSR